MHTYRLYLQNAYVYADRQTGTNTIVVVLLFIVILFINIAYDFEFGRKIEIEIIELNTAHFVSVY